MVTADRPVSAPGARDDRSTIPALPWWVLVASGSVFVIVAVLATAYPVVPGDAAISRAAQRVPGFSDGFVADSSNLLGDPLTSSLIVGALLVLCAVHRFARGAAFCAMVLASWAVGASLKAVFDSPRPSAAEALVRDDHFVGTGFPSGHALTVTMFASAATIILPALHRWTARTKAIVAAAWLWAVASMFSRVWLGAHWFTDVVGGFALGVTLTWLSAWAARRLRPAGC